MPDNIDVGAECNKLLKTASCLVRVIGDDKATARIRITECQGILATLQNYIEETQNGTTSESSNAAR